MGIAIIQVALTRLRKVQAYLFSHLDSNSITRSISENDLTESIISELLSRGQTTVVFVAIPAPASGALCGVDPEPVTARVNQDVHGLAWSAHIKLDKEFHAEPVAKGSPRLVSVVLLGRVQQGDGLLHGELLQCVVGLVSPDQSVVLQFVLLVGGVAY